MVKPNLNWTKLNPIPDPKYGKPCTRSSHGVSYIPSSDGKSPNRLVVYGGENIARTPLDASQATWICDISEDDTNKAQWRWISSSPPTLRVAHAQAYHRSTETLYVFGGRAGITMEEQAMNDLWILDCSKMGNETWTRVPATNSTLPEPRSFHKMICIGDSFYVFGGCGTNGRLNDMYRFDIPTKTWSNLGSSQYLRGRGGATLLSFNSNRHLGIVAGFAGEETNDGHVFDIQTEKWFPDSLNSSLEGLRPRSVCLSGSFPSVGVSIMFGGEVDPSAKGHEGAGGFENDIVLLDERTGQYLESIPASNSNDEWPETRGWSDGDGIDNGDGSGKLFFYGGLSGDDTNPQRLDDLWILNISKP